MTLIGCMHEYNVLTVRVLICVQKFAPEPVVLAPSSDEVLDLQQKLAILKQKRQEDKGKIKELEKFRAQLQQVCAGSACVRTCTGVVQSGWVRL